MLLNIVALVAGALILAVAADRFVLAAARISLALRISAVVVGAVVIGFGTSTPELVTGILAATQGSLDIAVGSVVGSNVANLTLIAGAAAAIAPITIASRTLRREAPLAVLATAVLAVLMLDGLTRGEAAVLAGAFVVVMGLMLLGARAPDEPLTDEVEHFAHSRAVGREGLWAAVALLGVVGGSQGLVWGASGIATEVGISDAVVGLTIVAVGTSLPELVTAIQAARRGEPDLIVGNLLGSSVFNALLIVAIAAFIAPGSLDTVEIGPTIAMVAVTVLAGAAMATGRRLGRAEGIALVAGYCALVPLVLI
ncbi:MAG: calcium/sodium antiporter [Miltoncostaeaceae bacterium]